jgi:hypothetical protein
MNEPREEPLPNVLKERPRKEPRLTKDLKAVTDTKHLSTTTGEVLNRLHNRRELRERPRSKVVPVRESARKNDEVGLLEIGIPMPNRKGLGLQKLTEDMHNVLVTIRTWEDDDGDSH